MVRNMRPVKFYDEDSNNAFGRERYVLSRVKHKNVIAMVEALWFTTDEGGEEENDFDQFLLMYTLNEY
eukprot:16796-Amorphochlora_amoeboformis.AAC.1